MKFTKKFVILFIIAILISAVLIFFLWDNYNVRKNDLLLQEQQKIQAYYSSVISSHRVIADIFYEESIDSPKLVGYLEQAYNSDSFTKHQLRESMHSYFNPIYERLKDKNLKYVNFYLANGENFLRMHNPNQFGNNTANNSYAIRFVGEQRRYIEGFEVSTDYNGYRYVFPLFNNGYYVGAVEIGMTLHDLYSILDSGHPLTFNFLLNREIVSRVVDLDISKDYFVSDLSKDYLYQRDITELKYAFSVSPETTAAIDWKIKKETANALPNSRSFFDARKVNDLNYFVVFLPVTSVSEQHIGYLIAYGFDNSVYILREGLYIQYIVVFSLIFVVLFFVYYINDSHSKLMDKNEELNNIAHTIGEGLLVVKKNGKVIFFNTAAEEITGFLSNEVLGKTFYKVLKFVTESNQSDNHHFVREVIRKKHIKIINKDIAILHKKDHLIPLAINAAPLRNKENKVLGCIIVFRDVTEEREIDKAKTEFVSLASHQLQTPLSAVNWHTEMLLDTRVGKLNKKQKEFLHAIYEGNHRMIKLVNSLLNVSRIDMGTLSVSPKLTNIAKMIDSILKELLFRVDIKDIKIIKDYSKTSKVRVDPQLMRIVMQNILSNAIKYSREKGKVIISMTKDKKDFMIAIQDHGYGIPKEQQPKIFTKLFRADNVKTRKVEGTGLGLYVAKSVIDAFGGKIWFKSQENKGTTFFISIPMSGAKEKKGTRTLEINT